jgi:hypothetical protein
VQSPAPAKPTPRPTAVGDMDSDDDKEDELPTSNLAAIIAYNRQKGNSAKAGMKAAKRQGLVEGDANVSKARAKKVAGQGAALGAKAKAPMKRKKKDLESDGEEEGPCKKGGRRAGASNWTDDEDLTVLLDFTEEVLPV